MDLIIGGAYQGKLEYARKRYGLADGDIYTCSESEGIRYGCRCLYKAEEFALWCVRTGNDAVELLEQQREEWKDSIFICEDIFCGVVPMEAELRKWREETGRLCAFLSAQAEYVTRLFCGIPQRLK